MSGAIDEDGPAEVMPGEVSDRAAYDAAIDAGEIEEVFPVAFGEEVDGALARYIRHGPSSCSWSVARIRGKGDAPSVPDRVARGSCARLSDARAAVRLMLAWVLESDGG